MDNCVTCNPGTICTSNPTPGGGATTSTCPINHYCPSGSKDPRICPPGTYTASSGGKTEDDCGPCPESYSCYNDPDPSVTPPSTSKECPAGFYCLPRTYFPHETPCPDKSYSIAKEKRKTCEPCNTPGTYCLEGSSFPANCEKGYYCVGDGTMKPCPAGTYADPNQASCTDCLPGTTCPEGYHEINPIKCPKGTYMAAAKSEAISCEDCKEGHACPNGEMSTPTPCPAKKWSIKGQTACSDCPGGYYCPGSPVELKKCTAGYYCPAGSSAETLCGAGYYCPAGSEKQLRCPPGAKCGTGLGDWQKVDPGSSSERDNSDVLQTIPCAEGFYCEEGSRTSQSKACPPGTYSQASATEFDSCKECEPGFYCPGGTGTAGSTAIAPMIICPVGHYCEAGAHIPSKCEIGTYNPITGLDDRNKCEPCLGGEVCSQRGLAASDYTCDPGYYCREGASISQPIDGTTGDYCTVGHYCERGTANPVPCPAGTFNVFIGCKTSDECLECPFGFICENADGSKENCPEGYYCPPGSTDSTKKEPGEGYHAIVGQGDKIPCIPGTFTDTTTASECKPCEENLKNDRN